MPFYSDSQQVGGFQPKRKFRFTVSFPNLGGELVYMCTKAKKPTYELGSKEHRFMNHEYKFPGIIKWQDVEVSFIDAKDPNTGSKFYKALLNAGYAAPDTLGNALQGITKISSVGSLGEVIIRQLDGGDVINPQTDGTKVPPSVLDTWTLKNAFIQKADFGELSYESDDLLEVSVTLRYDWAEYSDKQSEYLIGT
jgi:hypothetical protein